MARGEPDAVIFDLDGVLVDSGAHHRAAWRAVLDELGVTPPQPEYWRLTIGRPAEEAVVLLLGRPLSSTEARRLARRKHDHYRLLAREGLRPLPGVAAFVSELGRRGVPCAVATSASRVDTDRLLAHVGLRHHFSVVVTADDVRRGKPDPEVYLRAARELARPATACLAFEDSLVGVEAACRAGMRVIGVSTAHTGAELTAAGVQRVIADFEACPWPP